MKGQVTIEFILVLVVVLVILATVSLPTVDRIEQDVTDTGLAVSIASVQNRLANTAKELRMSGCGSHKNITVYLDANVFNEANVTWDGSEVNGFYRQLDGELKEMKGVPYPGDMMMIMSSGPGPYWDVEIKKICPTAGLPTTPCIGYCI